MHCCKAHLHRYIPKFDFRYDRHVTLGVSDLGRADQILNGVVAKRLTYETIQAK